VKKFDIKEYIMKVATVKRYQRSIEGNFCGANREVYSIFMRQEKGAWQLKCAGLGKTGRCFLELKSTSMQSDEDRISQLFCFVVVVIFL
jgi:hypothetical protein